MYINIPILYIVHIVMLCLSQFGKTSHQVNKQEFEYEICSELAVENFRWSRAYSQEPTYIFIKRGIFSIEIISIVCLPFGMCRQIIKIHRKMRIRSWISRETMISLMSFYFHSFSAEFGQTQRVSHRRFNCYLLCRSTRLTIIRLIIVDVYLTQLNEYRCKRNSNYVLHNFDSWLNN